MTDFTNLRQAKIVLEELAAKVTALEAEIKTAKEAAQKEADAEKKKALEADIAKKEEEMKKLTADVAEANKKQDLLKKDYEAVKADIAKIQAEIVDLKKQKDELTAQMNAKHADAEKAKAKIGELSKQQDTDAIRNEIKANFENQVKFINEATEIENKRNEVVKLVAQAEKKLNDKIETATVLTGEKEYVAISNNEMAASVQEKTNAPISAIAAVSAAVVGLALAATLVLATALPVLAIAAIAIVSAVVVHSAVRFTAAAVAARQSGMTALETVKFGAKNMVFMAPSKKIEADNIEKTKTAFRAEVTNKVDVKEITK